MSDKYAEARIASRDREIRVKDEANAKLRARIGALEVVEKRLASSSSFGSTQPDRTITKRTAKLKPCAMRSRQSPIHRSPERVQSKERSKARLSR